jgi:hypothetical protein
MISDQVVCASMHTIDQVQAHMLDLRVRANNSYRSTIALSIIQSTVYSDNVTFFLICLGVSVTNIAVFSALDDILPLGPCSPGKNLLCINDGL